MTHYFSLPATSATVSTLLTPNLSHKRWHNPLHRQRAKKGWDVDC